MKIIVVAEDDEAIRKLIRYILSPVYEVITVESSLDVIGLIQCIPNISMYILDYNMPIISGKVVYDRIREFNTNVPVVLMPGMPKDNLGISEIKDDKLWFIPKPFSLDKFKSIITEILVN